MLDFSKKSLVLVTGGSKGIGRSIAVSIARLLSQNSIIILMASTDNNLQQTKDLINEIDKTINVLTYSIDLSCESDRIESILNDILTKIDSKNLNYGFCFHNAGSIGEIKDTNDLINTDNWHKYYELNLFSVSILNSLFIKKFQSIVEQLIIINITSICGRVPFKNFAQYGSVKAARELFFKVFALEQPHIKVLNYSPGPVQTDMFDTIINTAENENVRNDFQNIRDTKLLTTEQTVGKMLDIIEKDQYKSGATIDYYD